MFVKVVEAERATQAIRSRAIELVTEMYEEKVACNDQQELDQDRTDRFLEENEKNIENMVERILEDNERELFEELFDRHKLEEYILNVLDNYIKLD
jgi:trans-2-enoyl-CoA reductase